MKISKPFFKSILKFLSYSLVAALTTSYYLYALAIGELDVKLLHSVVYNPFGFTFGLFVINSIAFGCLKVIYSGFKLAFIKIRNKIKIKKS